MLKNEVGGVTAFKPYSIVTVVNTVQYLHEDKQINGVKYEGEKQTLTIEGN